MCLRLDVPIFAEDALLAEAGFADEPEDEEEAESVVEEFRDFIESVNPEDFNG